MGLGSSRTAWVYAGSVGRGFEPAQRQLLTVSATVLGHQEDGRAHRQRLGLQARYYLPQSTRWLFFAGTSANLLRNPNPADALALGGDNGPRGYPLRYLSGTRRSLFTLEERYCKDLFPLRLFRVGAAAFVEVGRAWGGDAAGSGNAGWLRNAGLGLRFFSVRTAFTNVLHVDLTLPFDPGTKAEKVQLLVKTRASV